MGKSESLMRNRNRRRSEKNRTKRKTFTQQEHSLKTNGGKERNRLTRKQESSNKRMELRDRLCFLKG